MESNQLWQEDWEQFCNLLNDSFQSGDTVDVINSRLTGKEVIWSGILEGKDIDELAPGVYVELSEKLIRFNDGRVAKINGLALPITAGSVPLWDSIEVGSKIVFNATMGRGKSPFPPVAVKTFKSGKTIVTVKLSNGVLIGAV